ncbi:hypothetical protein JCGZ_10757 [Jatropha curcas]|uniref:Uncharacterized protein n=1 Tax=Jatropha curcas TaxID=180498 RepID=A0A067LQ24_JATCU|nr:hypothetical protein JCGZ_10757 [Jatropha curcas]
MAMVLLFSYPRQSFLSLTDNPFVGRHQTPSITESDSAMEMNATAESKAMHSRSREDSFDDMIDRAFGVQRHQPK